MKLVNKNICFICGEVTTKKVCSFCKNKQLFKIIGVGGGYMPDATIEIEVVEVEK